MTGTYMNSLTIQNYKNYKNENTSSKNQKGLVRTDWLSIIVRRKKAVRSVKDKIVSLFKNKYNTTRSYLVQRKSKRKKKSEDQIIKAI